jgi:hypothetical protein
MTPSSVPSFDAGLQPSGTTIRGHERTSFTPSAMRRKIIVEGISAMLFLVSTDGWTDLVSVIGVDDDDVVRVDSSLSSSHLFLFRLVSGVGYGGVH